MPSTASHATGSSCRCLAGVIFFRQRHGELLGVSGATLAASKRREPASKLPWSTSCGVSLGGCRGCTIWPLDVLHETCTRGGCAEVVIVRTALPLGRRRAEQRAAPRQEIGRSETKALSDQGIFLLSATACKLDGATSWYPINLCRRWASRFIAALERSQGFSCQELLPVQADEHRGDAKKLTRSGFSIKKAGLVMFQAV